MRFSVHVIAAVALATLAARSADAADAGKPNIVIIVADDLGYNDVGFHGGKEIPTPNLDRLAAGGVNLTNGYVSCPVCSPTRAGLATGRYQQRFGHEFNPGQAEAENGVVVGLPQSETTLASALKEAGYHTAIVGKWHLGSADGYRPLQRGFDEFYGFLGGAHPYVAKGNEVAIDGLGAAQKPGGGRRQGRKGGRRQGVAANDPNAGGANQLIYRGDEPTDTPPHLTQAFGDEAAKVTKSKHDKPFFLYLTFNAVHNPLQPDQEHLDRFASITDPKRRAYAGLLSGLDDAVGTVLAALTESGQDEETIIFFISDNGGPQQGNGSNNAPLHGDKATVWEGGIRVPYVVRWTGKLPAGVNYDQPAISLDIAATAAAVGGAKLGGQGRPLDGVNLIPFLAGENKSAPHEALYWRFGPQHAVRRGNFKLVKIANAEPQLFDLTADISESKDLSAARPEIVNELTELYETWNSQLADPLWKKGQAQGQSRRNAANRRQRRAGSEAQAAAEPQAS